MHTFWDTQPVAKLDESTRSRGEIIMPKKEREEIRQEPYTLPELFEWVNMDINDEKESEEIVKYVNANYVRDNKFKLNYSIDILKWYLNKNSTSLALGVKLKSKDLLVGFISGKVTRTQVNRHELDLVEVNFLSVNKKLRKKRLAAILIKEIIRRYELKGYYQGFYTGERKIMRPIFTSKYYHRAINVKKLVQTEFTKVSTDTTITIKDMERVHRLPSKPTNKNFKKMREKDIEGAHEVLCEYLERYSLHPIFSVEEFKDHFYGNECITSYVLLDNNEEVTNFISYYKLPSTNIKTKMDINNGYLYYYASITETPYRLIKDIMIVAKKEGMDVFTMQDVLENTTVINELDFSEGTGELYYYLYNWKCIDMTNIEVGKIAL